MAGYHFYHQGTTCGAHKMSRLLSSFLYESLKLVSGFGLMLMLGNLLSKFRFPC